MSLKQGIFRDMRRHKLWPEGTQQSALIKSALITDQEMYVLGSMCCYCIFLWLNIVDKLILSSVGQWGRVEWQPSRIWVSIPVSNCSILSKQSISNEWHVNADELGPLAWKPNSTWNQPHHIDKWSNCAGKNVLHSNLNVDEWKSISDLIFFGYWLSVVKELLHFSFNCTFSYCNCNKFREMFQKTSLSSPRFSHK